MSADFPPLQNDVFLRALRRQPVPYTPLWLMRQAGRYLPEYRALRAQAGSFMALAQHPEHAAEVTVQPIARYPLDAAILFSDILTVPDAMGLGLSFTPGEGPRFAQPVRTEADVAALAVPDMARLQYVFDAARLARHALAGRVPLIGFAGSPWTVACYMVEGGPSSDYRFIKTMLYARPDWLHRILTVMAEATTQYLRAQIDAGAQAVMIFDSWGGVLADGQYTPFSLAYIEKIIAGVRQTHGRAVPIIVFAKGGGLWLDALAACGCDALGVDWTVNLRAARAQVGARVALQGNLDPMVLLAGEAAIRAEVRRVLAAFGPVGMDAGHVFNLGHGISRHTPPEAVAVLVDEVHAASRAYHVGEQTDLS